ncbi:putative response regulator [Pedobacter sp. BAL39]|uniref:LytR/AlgR family response regulator transcription factor n=1 Tax=Pedobacter sp. BAL39 TaxID=391596 RepID=UPI0001559CE5|nr:LytTR family DNA-binding domain-containing protein [Pedobacter sp. BAL39]EDM36741.1 putative response regulator [Pedobacter sp. BAL39]
MKILIIEDEIHNANRLQSMVREICPDVVIAGILESVADSIDWFKHYDEPDLILMDVRLADGLCFEIFSACTITAPVIFTTAYDEYAIRAFKVNSIDYLLKPVHKPELEAALSKLRQISGNQHQADPMIANLVEIIKKQEPVYRNRFLIQVPDGYRTVHVDDIQYIYSEFKVTHLVLTNDTVYTVSQTMDELEEQLDPGVFFRANRQHIISVHSIRDIHNFFNGKLKVVLHKHPEVEILISREKAALFKHWLDR